MSAAATTTTAASDVAEIPSVTTADEGLKAVSNGTLDMKTVGAAGIVSSILSIVFGLIFCIGAAKLSYDRFGSAGWAFLDFLFAYFYYPYYAFFISGPVQQPSSSLFGGKRRKH